MDTDADTKQTAPAPEAPDPTATPAPDRPSGEAPSSPGLDLDARVKMDGKEYSIRELIDAQKRAENAAETAKALEERWNRVQGLWGQGASLPTDKERTETRQVLYDLGWRGQALEQQMAAMFSDEDGQQPAAPRSEQTQPEDPSQSQAGRGNPMHAKLLKQMLEQQMTKTLSDAASQDEVFTGIIEGIKKRDGAEVAEQVREAMLSDAKQLQTSLLREQLDKTGTFDLNSVGPASIEALKKAVGKARLYTGDPKELGRARVEAGEDPFDYLKDAKPSAVPQRKAGNPSIEGALKERGTDVLTRVAAGMLGGSREDNVL